MAGRGAQTFQKRQKEQQRKERAQEKFAKRLERKKSGADPETEPTLEGEFEHTADTE
jgi:putative component of toxin-antitoxin plasmid stabilization module